MSVVVVIRSRNGGGVDSIGIQEGVFSSIHRFVWGHVDNIGVASVRLCCHFGEGGEPIGLAEVDNIPQGSLEFPDLAFGLSIRLVVARRSHDVFDSHCLESLFPNLEVNWGSESLTIELGTS